MQSVWMRVFQGEDKPIHTSITTAVAYEKLASGEHIYGKCLNLFTICFHIIRIITILNIVIWVLGFGTTMCDIEKARNQ